MKNKNYFFRAADIQLSFIVCCIVNVIFTIVKESTPAVKQLLKNTFGNGWLGQMIIMAVFFILLAFASKLFLKNRIIKFTSLLPVIIIASVSILFIFYTI